MFFAQAKKYANLTTELTASLGRRTKYQHSDYAQLYLFAKSSLLLDKDKKYPSASRVQSITEGDALGCWQHSEWELGKRLVGEAVGGEEAAVRYSNVILYNLNNNERLKKVRLCSIVWMEERM
jgi:hypothetical protein